LPASCNFVRGPSYAHIIFHKSAVGQSHLRERVASIYVTAPGVVGHPLTQVALTSRIRPKRSPAQFETRNMKAKVKLIKKEDRNGPVLPVEAQAGADPKEWSTAVKSWVKEFQEDRRDGSLEAFDNLFGDSTP
jgi:hypothetical protein